MPYCIAKLIISIDNILPSATWSKWRVQAARVQIDRIFGSDEVDL